MNPKTRLQVVALLRQAKTSSAQEDVRPWTGQVVN